METGAWLEMLTETGNVCVATMLSAVIDTGLGNGTDGRL